MAMGYWPSGLLMVAVVERLGVPLTTLGGVAVDEAEEGVGQGRVDLTLGPGQIVGRRR